MKAFVSIIAMANFAVTVLHLFLAGKLNPALTVAGSVRIGAYAAALTLAGVGLLWTRGKKIGSFVLIIEFAIGLVIGSLEHFFIAGPNNVFDAGYSGWAILFDATVALLLVLEIAGLWSSGRILVARSQ
ncbi:MAG: hypothetical protein ABSG72_19410 [Candidatus Sulfotelmatobacter sp.]|jgi:hypothetical protein